MPRAGIKAIVDRETTFRAPMAGWAAIIFYKVISIFPNDAAYYRCVHATVVLRGAQAVSEGAWPLRLYRGDLRNAGDCGCSRQWGLRGMSYLCSSPLLQGKGPHYGACWADDPTAPGCSSP